MAKRKVNKNLVAGLTIGGIVLSVAVVVAATYGATKRDPAVFAKKGADLEKAGQLEGAARQYGRAFAASKSTEAIYLVDAARCYYGMGEFSQTFGLLRQAHAQSPSDPQVLKALLERYWELRSIGWRGLTELREYAEKLLEIEPTNMLALVCRVDALNGLASDDPKLAPLADEALDRALKQDETDPRLALVRAGVEIRRGAQAATSAMRSGDAATAKDLIGKGRARAIELLRAALEKSQSEPRLVTNLAELLRATGKPEECRAVLLQASKDMPNAAEVHLGLASFILGTDLAEGATVADRKAAIDQALAAVERSIALEPAMFESYAVLAELREQAQKADGTWEADRAASQKKVLETFVEAQDRTVKLKSLRAVLGGQSKAQMIASAFDKAMSYYADDSSATEASRTQALTYARRFRDDTRTQFPDHVFLPFMEGRLALADNDLTLAIKSFTDADEKAVVSMPYFARQAKEQLGMLHAQKGNSKLALRYLDESLAIGEGLGMEPSRRQVLQRAQLLSVNGQNEEALDYLDKMKQRFPDDNDLVGLRARVLALLGKGEEGLAALKQTGSTNVDVLMNEARIAGYQNDLATAEAKLRQVLEQTPEHLEAIRMFVQVMTQADKRDEAVKVLDDLMGKTQKPPVRLSIQTMRVLLSTENREEREAKLLELINQIEDPQTRTAELFNYWQGLGNVENAARYLDELEKLRGPENEEVARLQFTLALRRGDVAKAESYVTRLTKLNADYAGGATFRGQLHLAQGDVEGALGEFRAAERELPTDAGLKVQIGRALMSAQPPRVEDAIQTLRQAIDFDPRLFDALKMLYVCYEQLGRHDEAVAYLKRAAELRKNDEFVRSRQRLLDEIEDPRKGIAYREPIRKEKPEDVENLVRLSALYERVNELDKAEEVLKEAAARETGSVRMAAAVARFYSARQNRAAGEEYLRSFLASVSGATRIDGQVLLARFYRAIGDEQVALAACQDGEQRIDEFAGGDAEVRRRGKLALSLELADIHAAAGRYPETIAAYRAALAQVGKDDPGGAQELRLKIVKALINSRQFGEAQKELASYQGDFPKDVRGLMGQAELLLRSNPDDAALGQARELLNRALTEQPESIWSLLMRAKVSAVQRNYAEARDDLLRIKSLDASAFNFEPRTELARVYELMGNNNLAERELRDIFRDSNRQQDYAVQLLSFFQRTDQLPAAQQFVNELIATAPNEPYWHFQMGRLLAQRGEYSAAVNPLRRAVDLTAGGQPALVSEWLTALTRSGRAAEAVAALPNLKPEVLVPAVRLSLAEALAKQGQRPAAREQIEQALAVSTQSLDVTAVVAAAAAGILGGQETVSILRAAVEQAAPPAKLTLKTVLGRTLLAAGQDNERAAARTIAEEVIADASAAAPVKVAALLVKASAMDADSEPQAVAKVYEEALAISPNEVQALNNLAYLLADRLKRPADAVPYAERAAALYSHDANVQDTLGWVYHQNGNARQAEAALLEALRIQPDNLPSREHLGLVYVKANRTVDARKAYEQLRESARKKNNDEYVKKAEEALAGLR